MLWIRAGYLGKLWDVGERTHCHSFVRSLLGKSPLERLLCPFLVKQSVGTMPAFRWLGFEAVNRKAACCQGQPSKEERALQAVGGCAWETWQRRRGSFCWPDPCALSPQRTPWFNGWGFNLPRGQSLLDKWNLIPEGIDILMTHGPPLGKWSKGYPFLI